MPYPQRNSIPYSDCSCCICRYGRSKLPPCDLEHTPFAPLPDCNCPYCRAYRHNALALINPPTQNAPHSLNPLLMPLSTAWQDAIAGALALGMAPRTANRIASPLAIQFPNASRSQALALILQNT